MRKLYLLEANPVFEVDGVRKAPSRLMLALAVHHPRPVGRRELAAAVWGASSEGDGGNRLRVALARLRKVVPLVESGGEVSFAPGSLWIDLAEVRGLLQQVSEEPDPNLERDILRRLLPVLGANLGIEGDETWVVQAQAEWSAAAQAGILRLAEIGAETEDAELRAEAAAFGLRRAPWDVALWSHRLLGSAAIGQGEEALRAFAAAERELLDEGLDFSSELTELAEAVRSGSAALFSLPPAELDLVGSFFQRCVAREPEMAVRMLASDSFRPEVLRRPAEAVRLLRSVVAKAPGPSDELERCRVRIVSALLMMGDLDGVIEEGETLLREPVQPARRRIALLNLSYAYFAQNRSSEALAAIDEAIRIAEETGMEYDAWQCRCQRAIYVAIDGVPDSAIPILREGIAYLERADAGDLSLDSVVIQANLGLAHLLAGDPASAERELKKADQAARERKFRDAEALTASLLGWAYGWLGDEDRARPNSIRALRLAARLADSRRTVQVLEAAVRVLFHTGDPRADEAIRVWSSAVEGQGLVLKPHQLRLYVAQETTSEPPDLLAAVRWMVDALRSGR